MRIIKEGDQGITRLWGKQNAKPTAYRFMKYLIHETVDQGEILCNNVTGELVLLSEEESKLTKADVITYCDTLKDLVEDHFLVPVDYDEYDAITGMRKVLRMLAPKPKYITHYTILPTTACNARCYYCFEKGSKIETMTEQTAKNVVKFIIDNCGPIKQISIIWFGGEPTVAVNRIDQICEGLQNEGVEYTSMMYTNGYLCDEWFVRKAKELWHLDGVQMSVDGTEKIYNSVKAYVKVRDNPYQKVMRNIGYMLENEITVAIRMNVDYINYENFADLVQECAERYKDNPLFNLSAYALIGEHKDHNGDVNHASESWISDKVQELNQIAKENGFIHQNYDLPHLAVNACMADSDASITITPDGNLVKCGEQYNEENSIGTVTVGVNKSELVEQWKITNNAPECSVCVFSPDCIQLSKCSGSGHCYRQGKNQRYIWNSRYITNCYFEKEGNQNET